MEINASIRQGGNVLGYIETVDGQYITSGIIGENAYQTLENLIIGLQGFDISLDHFFF